MPEAQPLTVRLLRLLGGGGIRSTAELAQALGVHEGLVRMMAEDLARRGYLAALDERVRAWDASTPARPA